jgi:hypothetical protein
MRILWLHVLLCFSTIASAGDMKAARRAAAARPRPLIFNNDGCDVVYEMKQPTVEDLLSRRTAPLAGSQVSTIFYCTISSPFGVFTHHSKVGDLFKTREAPFAANMTQALLERQIDPLRVMVDWCRANHVELFWSMRMNDTHDAGRTGYGPVMFRTSRVKTQHPDWLMSTVDNPLKFGKWSSVDYGRAEIRDLAFRYVEEVCRNYDVDGIELDFLRHALFFRSSAAGAPATTEELGQMTDLLRRIRTMADDVGAQRGRPILLAMRVPDSVEYCKAIGLDLETWLRDDLLDLLVTAGYTQLNPVDYSVVLAHQYGVKVYPSLDETRIKDQPGSNMRSTLLAYRGRTMAAWASGVDGIYMFNFFDPTSPLWNELGDPSKLNTLDKDYFASIRGSGAMPVPHQPFQKAPTLNPSDPLKLEVGKTTSVDIVIGDDFAAAQAAGRTAAVLLRLIVKNLQQARDIDVRFNGVPINNAKMTNGWLEAPLAVTTMKRGQNAVSLTPKPDATFTTWRDLHITVRYSTKSQTAK